MRKSFALALFALAVTVSADHLAGVWKLNPAKSKYTGMPAPKELTVTYAMQAGGWTYAATGMSASGDAINSSFTVVKDGEEAKTTGFPNWDGIVMKNNAADKSTATFMRQGKSVGTGTRSISADGKTMTITGRLTLPNGKKASYVSVYDKQ